MREARNQAQEPETYSSNRKKRSKKVSKKLLYSSAVLGLIGVLGLLFSSIVMVGAFYMTDFFPARYLYIIGGVLIVFNVANIIIEFILHRRYMLKLVTGIIAILLSLLMLYAAYAAYHTSKVVDNASGVTIKTNTVGVFVAADDSAKKLSDAKNYTFGILKDLDTSSTNEALEDINGQLGSTVKTEGYSSVVEIANAFRAGKIKGFIISESFINMFEGNEDYEEYSTFKEEIKIIYEHTITSDIDTVSTQAVIDSEITTKPFTIYFSGIDTEGAIGTTSRSDVNLLAIVNPSTKQILLVNTPRDYFLPLPISNGVRDKLTHAGLYGIDCSMGALETEYGIDIDYYIRVNFTGCENIIDALGGVTVWSDYDFTSYHGEYDFVKGWNKVNGAEALGYVRERYSFPDGDFQRGRDQMYLIQAIVAKIESPAILTKYDSLLSSIEGSFQTNMTYDEITALVQMQLNDGSSWNIQTYTVSGEGDYSTCYSIPTSKVYVTIPDETTVTTAKGLIQEIKDGKTPDVPKS